MPNASSQFASTGALSSARLPQTANPRLRNSHQYQPLQQLNLVPSGKPATPNLRHYPTANQPAEAHIDETELIRQMIFVFQGIETKDIKLNHRENAFTISNLTSADKRHKQLCHQMCMLGWLHERITKFVKDRSRDSTYGLVGQALCAALQQEMREYYRLLSVLQTQLQSSALTFLKLTVWTGEPLEKLKWIASLVDHCKGKRGGEILSILHSYMQTGDPDVRALTCGMMRQVSRPTLQVIDRWIYDGELHDPCREFFVTSDPAVGVEQLWSERYKMELAMVPSFVPIDQAHKILLVGKTINFLRLVCNDRSQIVNNRPPSSRNQHKFQDGGGSLTHDLAPRVDQAYRATSAHLLQVLNDRYKLRTHLHALRKFLLLGQGEFIRTLLDNLEGELKKPAEKIFRFNLQGHVEAAIRASNAQYEDSEVLQCLDLRILQRNKGDTGWNVFSLDYHAQPPLSTIITPHVINEYLKIFMFLWRAKRVRHQLTEVWMKSMEYSRKFLPDIRELQAVLHKCHILTTEMWNFVHQFHYYVAFEVLECSWADFHKTLNDAKDLDHVIKAHHDFVNTLMKRCLLDRSSSDLLKGLRGIFGEILKFQILHENMFAQSMLELKLRRKYQREQEEKEAKGVWGENDEETEAETKRRREFRKVTVANMRAQLQVCANAFQDMVIKFLAELTQADDDNLRNLSWRLDFNESYRQRAAATRYRKK